MQLIRLYTVLILLLGAPMLSNGQEPNIQKSTEKIRVDGQVCYIHNVKKGETIYSLCKVYAVSQDDLLKYNPQLADGLKDGQVLRIPELKQAAVADAKPRTMAGTVMHEVKRKETLYSISQQYGCTVEDIKRLNPTIDEDIQKGQLIIVPQGGGRVDAVEDTYTTPETPSGNKLYYLVKKGESLHSIATRYSVSEADLKLANPDAFTNGQLMEGAVLRIPRDKQTAVADNTAVNSNPPTYYPPRPTDNGVTAVRPENSYRYNRSDAFNVAFLLPLSKGIVKKTNDDGEVMSSTGNKKTDYLEFYEGALLALDSLSKTGLSVNVYTLDVSDSRSMSNAIHGNDLSNVQMVIAPVSDELVKQLAEFAQEKQIPIVLPTATLSDSLLATNPYLIQLKTQKADIRDRLIKDVCQTGRNVVLVKDGSGRNADLFAFYQKQLDASGCKYRTLTYSISRSRAALGDMIENSRENHLIVAVDSKESASLIADFTANLDVSTSKNRSNTFVYGASRWRGMESLNITKLYNLNLRVSQAFFIDYSNAGTKRFVSRYRSSYKGEPSNYAFLGYDATLYFLQCLKTYGQNFTPYLTERKEAMLQSNFEFKQIENGGMKNGGAFMLEYQPSLDILRK